MGAESSKYHQDGRLLTPTMYRKGYKSTPKSEPSRSPRPAERSGSPELRSATPSSIFTSRSRTFERYSPIDNYRERERERIRDYDKDMEIMTLRKSPISYERRIGSKTSTMDASSSTREPLKSTNENTNRELVRASSPSPSPVITYSTPILTKLNTEDIARIRMPNKSSSETGEAKDSTNPKYQYSSETKVEKTKSGATTTVQFTSLEKKSTSETTYSPLFYGHFSCTKCTRVWTSRISQEDKPQACSRCNTLILPTINKPTE